MIPLQTHFRHKINHFDQIKHILSVFLAYRSGKIKSQGGQNLKISKSKSGLLINIRRKGKNRPRMMWMT